MLGGYMRPRTGPKLTRDEELGKRDDDFRPKARSSLYATLMTPSKWRKRRIFFVCLTVILVYFFVANIPTDLEPINQRLGVPRTRPPTSSSIPPQEKEKGEPSGPPPKPRSSEVGAEQYYFNGPIKFYRLGSSLNAASRTGGFKSVNRNILFAASSLKSVANLMPLACEMAQYDRNYVHLAVMGRVDVPMDTILDINGVDEDSCPVYFHDARPDYAEFSMEYRAELAVAGGMEHINYYMHPQAVIMDDSMLEDRFFTRSMRSKAKDMSLPLIEIPAEKYEDFLWMTRLDSKSIASWFRPTIDILIHAPPDGAGGMVRLMKSLLKADYTGLRVPKITIEMPPTIDGFAMRYLEEIDWPPEQEASPLHARTLSFRHRIPTSRVTSEEASIRFLESFYPSDSYDNHVLVLSAQTELSPLFLHYLFYTLLEYKYSSYDYGENDNLLGLSLNIPTSFVNGTGDFTHPTLANMNDERYTDDKNLDKSQKAFFAYQAPSASASLIFGDKWVALHNYLANRLTASHAGKAQQTRKLVSEAEPSWLEYVLELMRARGWTMLHPPTSYATVHNELAKFPEEHQRPKKTSSKDTPAAELEKLKDEPFLLAAKAPAVQAHIEEPVLRDTVALHRTLPFEGDLPELPHVPHISHLGHMGGLSKIEELQDDFVIDFRRQIGGCDDATAKKDRNVYDDRTDDLFCLPGQELEFAEDSTVGARVGDYYYQMSESASMSATMSTKAQQTPPSAPRNPSADKVPQAKVDQAPQAKVDPGVKKQDIEKLSSEKQSTEKQSKPADKPVDKLASGPKQQDVTKQAPPANKPAQGQSNAQEEKERLRSGKAGS